MKRFVVIGHTDNAAILLKATSKTERFLERTDLLSGVVFCRANEFDQFEQDTVIDPANAFAVPHIKLRQYDSSRLLENLGVVEPLRERLTAAIERNITIERARRRGLLRCLDVD